MRRRAAPRRRPCARRRSARRRAAPRRPRPRSRTSTPGARQRRQQRRGQRAAGRPRPRSGAWTPPLKEGVSPGSSSRQRRGGSHSALEPERALQVVDAAQLGRLVAVERDVQGAAVARSRSRRRSPPPARRRSPGRARPRRRVISSSSGSPKASSPTGASIPAATRVAPAGGCVALEHRRPGRRACASAPGAGEADRPRRRRLPRRNCALSLNLASAGITRIRSRRSVASMPPSQPRGLHGSRITSDATPRRRQATSI